MFFSYIHPVSKISVTDAGEYPVFKIHSRVIPGSTWSVFHPGGPRRATPPGSSQFLVIGGYRSHPRRLIWTPVQGGYPGYHSILVFPRRASSWSPYPQILALPCHQYFSHQFSCVFSVQCAAQNLYAKPSTDRKILLTICLVPRPHYSAQINDQF